VIFHETPLPGSWVVQCEPIQDDRGAFARTFAVEEFERQGMNPSVQQCSVSFNPRRGTLRGLHYQADPHGECKLIRCTRGAIFDVLVDIRPESPFYCRWFGVELTPDNGKLLYAPSGVAHGLLTLADTTEIAYQMSAPHVPSAARGLRWNDPAFGVDWPAEVSVISERDRTYPDFGA
jgi:dTDP-4-dehydrorhamnose 3,5-epimerase